MTAAYWPVCAPPLSGLWQDVLAEYGLRVDELVLLEAACRTADYVAKLDAALVDAPLVVTGSMGQEREYPLLSEARQQRALLARLLHQIDLPDGGCGRRAPGAAALGSGPLGGASTVSPRGALPFVLQAEHVRRLLPNLVTDTRPIVFACG